ncbi:MAG: RES family NAD+ phosphorylase, partial [Pseudolabrys sp.]
GRAIDLTQRPFAKHMAIWTDQTNYDACQKLADTARTAAVDLIRYRSARDPDLGTNIALLSCRAFAHNEPAGREAWHVQLSASGARLICEFPRLILNFDRATFAKDPRIAAMNWDR